MPVTNWAVKGNSIVIRTRADPTIPEQVESAASAFDMAVETHAKCLLLNIDSPDELIMPLFEKLKVEQHLTELASLSVLNRFAFVHGNEVDAWFSSISNRLRALGIEARDFKDEKNAVEWLELAD